MKLPNFLIVGVPKAGTTSVYYWLKQHPDIYMSPVKEPHYFSQIGNEDHITDWNEYLKLFRNVKNEKAIGEASTSYFHFWDRSIPLIKEKLGNPKIIVILRNPVERAWSHFQMYIKYSLLKKDANIFKDYPLGHPSIWGVRENPYIYFSFYSKALKEYLRNFDQVKISLYDELKRNPKEFIRKIYKFLEVNEDFIPSFEVRNVSGSPRNKIIGKLLEGKIVRAVIPMVPYFVKDPLRKLLLKKEEIPKDIKEKLLEIFYEDIKETEQILKVDLSDWLR